MTARHLSRAYNWLPHRFSETRMEDYRGIRSELQWKHDPGVFELKGNQLQDSDFVVRSFGHCICFGEFR